MSKQKQHCDYYKKILLRRNIIGLLKKRKNIVCYVPFCGDGDIAYDVYRDYKLYASDINPNRVETFKKRGFANAEVLCGDSNNYSFMTQDAFTIADFDAYCDPYPAMRSFFALANTGREMAIFVTDGRRYTIVRNKKLDGKTLTRAECRRLQRFYFQDVMIPLIKQIAHQYTIKHHSFYLRSFMCYAGFIICR